MVSGKALTGLFVAVVIAAALFGPFANVVNDSTGSQTVDNATVAVDFNESVDLDGYQIDENSETVEWYNSTSGQWETATSPDDYSMNYEPGTIDFNSSSTNFNDGDDARVSYTYQATTGTTTTIAEQLPMFFALLVLGVIAGKLMKMS